MRIDLVPQVGTHSAIGDQVNLASEQCFQILLQADKIEKTAARLHRHKEVNVAVGRCLIEGDRAEDTDAARAVPGCDGQNLRSLVAQDFGRSASPHFCNMNSAREGMRR
jgi:hypothetical protein